MKHSLAHIEEIAASIGIPADALTLYGSSPGKARNKRPACRWQGDALCFVRDLLARRAATKDSPRESAGLRHRSTRDPSSGLCLQWSEDFAKQSPHTAARPRIRPANPQVSVFGAQQVKFVVGSSKLDK
jgi:hypothetical protein